MKESSRDKSSSRQKRRRRGVQEHRFVNYLRFGYASNVALLTFVLCYGIVLLTLEPLLRAQPKDIPEERPQDYINHPHLPPSLREVDVSGKVSELASSVRKRLNALRHGHGVTDSILLNEAQDEFERKRREKQMVNQQQEDAVAKVNAVANVEVAMDGEKRRGFIVLGMHRSGTSMLSGLLHTSCGYTVGGPLIGSAFDNEKGFFERVDVVLQNDEFMNKQRVYWSANVINYDYKKALEAKDSGDVQFKHGKTGLEFFNNPSNAPWMQKDPRMCITLKTWLELMNNEPAIVFTYRHPLEVAMSLRKREAGFPVNMCLRLWIVYNMRAIQNSKGLCMVRSSNEAILADPLNEVQRISDELTSKCNVPPPPGHVTQDEVDKFVDTGLQHNKKRREVDESARTVIAEYNDGKCKVYDYEKEPGLGEDVLERERRLYEIAMKIYCDFQSGIAFDDNYEWPELP